MDTNDMSFDSLKAGRELDALIGRELFGTNYEFVYDDYMIPDPDDPIAYDVCPHYSTDIAAAWQVIEKLFTLIQNQDIHIEHLAVEGEGYWGVSTCYELGEWKDWVRAETAPLAICIAALKAIAPKNV